MKAVRLHKFHTQPVIDEVPEPKISGPLDVIVKIGGAGVCRPLLASGRTPDELAGMTLGEAPPSSDRERLRSRRADLGLPSDDGSPLLVDVVSGEAVGPEGLPLHLRRARLTRVNAEANGSMCRGMLQHRYGTRGEAEVEEVR